MTLHAWRRRRALDLSAGEVCQTVETAWRFSAMIFVGLLSCLLARLFRGSPLVVLAGWCYALIGPLEAAIGLAFGRRRARLGAVSA